MIEIEEKGDKLNSYALTSAWFQFAFDNPEKIKTGHHALYFWCIELCNSLGWKEKFGLPTQHSMEVLGIKNYRTYIEYLKEVIDFGFIEMVQISKNQHTSNIIALVKNTKASTKAYTKALPKQLPKQSQSNYQSIASIDKLLNKETNKHIMSGEPDNAHLEINAVEDASLQTATKELSDNEKADWVIQFLNEETGKSFRFIKSNRAFIIARLKEKYVGEDFKKVIKFKTEEWRGTENDQYLRPETLFGKKFDGYLQAATARKMKTEIKPRPSFDELNTR